MIEKIELKHKPRRVGKTTKLLKIYYEHILNTEQVIYICCTQKEARRLQDESQLDSSSLHENPIISYYMIEDILRGRFNSGDTINIIFDEPFICDLMLQQDILKLLEKLPYSFYIYGEGTLRENFRKDFTHYLVDY